MKSSNMPPFWRNNREASIPSVPEDGLNGKDLVVPSFASRRPGPGIRASVSMGELLRQAPEKLLGVEDREDHLVRPALLKAGQVALGTRSGWTT